MLLGATALPAIAGAPTTAMAAPIAAAEGTPVESGSTSTGIARAILFGETSLDADARTSLGRVTPQSFALGGMEEALLRMMNERQYPSTPTRFGPMAGAGIEEDIETTEKVTKVLAPLLERTNDVPPDLVADLDHVTKALKDAKPGKAADALDKALQSLPSLKHAAPTAGSLARADSLTKLINSTPKNIDARIATSMASYNAGRAIGVGALNTLPDFNFTLPMALNYTAPNGDTVQIPAGSKISKNGTTHHIEAPALMMTKGTTTIVAGASTIDLSDTYDGMHFDSLNTSRNGTTMAGTGVDAGIDRTGTATSFIRADHAKIDFDNNSIDLTNGKLSLDPQGVLRLQADKLFAQVGSDSGTVTGLVATHQQVNGAEQFAAFAQTADLSIAKTAIHADNMMVVLVDSSAPGASDTAMIRGDNVTIDGHGVKAAATKANLLVTQNADGSSAVNFFAQDLHLETGKTVVDTKGSSNLQLTYDTNGDLASATASAKTLDITDPRGTVDATNGKVDMTFGKGGQLLGATATAKKVAFTNDSGKITADGGKLDLKYDEQGVLRSVTANAKGASYLSDNGTLTAKNGTVHMTLDKDGDPSRLLGRAKNVSWEGKDGLALGAKNTSLAVIFDNNGDPAHALTQWGSLDVTTPGGALISTGKTGVYMKYDDGALKNVRIDSRNISYDSKAVNGHDLSARFDRVSASIDIADDGSQTMKVTGKEGKVDINGHRINLDDATHINIHTRPDGTIDKMDAKFDGRIKLTDEAGDLSVKLYGAEAAYDDATSTLTASFDKGKVKLKSMGLTAKIEGVKARADDRQIHLHIDSAKVKKKLGESLNVKVENVDLIIDRNATGGIASADAYLGSMKGHIVGMDIMASTKGGDRIRLHTEMSEDGTTIRSAFLQIPTGGEIQIDKGKLHLTLGGDQRFDFEQPTPGYYRLSASGLDVLAKYKKTTVKVTGGTAAIAMNEDGELVIEKINGTKVHVKHKKLDINIDIQQLDGFLFRMTGIKGAAQGARIHLVPTSDASVINLQVHTKVSGIPIRLELDNVHELEALAEMGDNQLHVLAQDPSGRGTIRLGAGPLKIEGSAIEAFAKYNEYDSQRMLSLIGRLASKDGIQPFKGLTFEPDGIVRLETPNESGPHLGLTVVLPQGTGALPAYVLDIGGQDDGGAGALLTFGGRGYGAGGHHYRADLFAGAVPGSFVDWRLEQGTASLGGVPLPDEMRLPATGIAGIDFGIRGRNGTNFGAMVGGMVNPGGLVNPDGPEPAYGGFAGLRLDHKDRVSVGADALVDITKDGTPTLGGARLTLGVRF